MIELGGGLLYRVVGDLFRWWRRRSRRLTPAERVDLRAKWKGQIEHQLVVRRKSNLRSDVIFRDVRRVDEYPDTEDRKKGISPWFKVGLMDTYHRGLMVCLDWVALDPIGGDRWVYADRDSTVSDRRTLALTGFVRFENIQHIDWDGDEYYSHPQVFCHFDEKGGTPYERAAYCEAKELDGIPYYTEIASFESVEKASKEAGRSRYA